MSGSGRRRGSKWDMKEDMSPENRHDIDRSNNTGNSFHEREPREYTSGRRLFQRDDRINEESLWNGGGHQTRRISPGPDGWRQQSRSRSPRRSMATSYRSRSRSRSRSPAHKLHWEPSVHKNSGKSGHSAPLCRDFASGRCKKGDFCRFAHHTSPNHDSRRQYEGRTGDGWESRRGNDGTSRHRSDTYSSANICNDFLKGRCTRGASCRYTHHESGFDEFGKGGRMDGSYRDGDNDWRFKRGNGYEHEARFSSESVCKFFAAGNCRNGKHCKFSHQREGQFNSERRSPDSRQREYNMEGTHKVWNDTNWGDRTSLSRVPEERGWDGEGSDRTSLRRMPEERGWDVQKSEGEDWSKGELLNRQFDNPNYMKGATNPGSENITNDENKSLQWESQDIPVSEAKGVEKGFNDGKILSPKGTFNSQIGLVGQRSDSLSVSEFPQTSVPYGEQETSQRAPSENLHQSGTVQPSTTGDYSQPSISTNFGQGIGQNNGFGAQPVSSMDNPVQSHPTFPLHQLGVENMQMAHHRPVLDSNLGMGQTQTPFPSTRQNDGTVQSQTPFSSTRQNEGLQMSHHQPIIDPNPNQPAPAVQSTILNEQLMQYSNLSATLVQLLEKRQQLPQLYAAIAQQTAQPIQAPQPTRQYDPISDSFETKLAGKVEEQKMPVLEVTEIPISNCNPSSFASGDPKMGLSERNGGVSTVDETGKTTGNETREALDEGPTDDVAMDSGADDSKKAKEAKGIRPFKFALAEFVKELLKPTWKGGKMSKEVYKNIVKKVVDKVTDTIQVAHIPRSKEKIDQYLSLSKPKLNKLTQAYLEKYHKT